MLISGYDKALINQVGQLEINPRIFERNKWVRKMGYELIESNGGNFGSGNKGFPRIAECIVRGTCAEGKNA